MAYVGEQWTLTVIIYIRLFYIYAGHLLDVAYLHLAKAWCVFIKWTVVSGMQWKYYFEEKIEWRIT